MQFIANFWYLWLFLMIIFGAYTILSQLRRMRSVASAAFGSGSAKKMLASVGRNFYAGMGKTLAAGAVAGISGMLLLIAIVMNIAQALMH